MTWKNRISGYATCDPTTLRAHDRNWRVHSAVQTDALRAVLDEVGLVQNVVVSQHTGKVLDGHLRVALALELGETALPVTYVDVTEAEERYILATLDPLASLAEASTPKLAALLAEVQSGAGAVQRLLGDLAERHQLWPQAWLQDEMEAPAAFAPVQETADYAYRCPKCQHTWNGRPK
jgi:hypothetical protein